MSKSQKTFEARVGRRGFLKGAAAGTAASAAGLVGTPALTQAQDAQPALAQGGRGGRPGGQAALAREDGTAQPSAAARVIEHPGSDYMVDVIKALGIEFVA